MQNERVGPQRRGAIHGKPDLVHHRPHALGRVEIRVRMSDADGAAALAKAFMERADYPVRILLRRDGEM